MFTPMTADQPATDPVAPAALAGWPVLVTRPAGAGDALITRLHAHGATVFAAPVLQIDALPETAASRALAQQLDQFDVVIVTSRHAVQHGMSMLESFWPQWPAGVHWLAVGAATAGALQQFGVHAEAPADARSEGLLALPALQELKGKRILLVTGDGGRGLLEQELAARGATVQRLAGYRRLAVTTAPPALTDFAAAISRHPAAAGAVLVTSAEALQNLLALAPWLRTAHCRVIVASERIAGIARAAGLSRVHNANGADDVALVAALVAGTAAPADEDRT